MIPFWFKQNQIFLRKRVVNCLISLVVFCLGENYCSKHNSQTEMIHWTVTHWRHFLFWFFVMFLIVTSWNKIKWAFNMLTNRCRVYLLISCISRWLVPNFYCLYFIVFVLTEYYQTIFLQLFKAVRFEIAGIHWSPIVTKFSQ